MEDNIEKGGYHVMSPFSTVPSQRHLFSSNIHYLTVVEFQVSMKLHPAVLSKS